MFEEDKILQQIEDLKLEHRTLDSTIENLRKDSAVSPLQLQRLKKRKLMVRDQITYLQAMLNPDLIA